MGIVRDRWVSPDQPGDGQMPRAILNGRNDNGRLSTRYIEDGSYLRIRNLTLGYNFSPNAFRWAGIQNFRLYVSGQNLHTFTKYTLYDPEATDRGGSAISPGVDSGGYPLPLIYTFGLTTTF
jgi:TonB-dependent starch-binding outer membrane protein SusC